ncbi:MAG: hypothetical protein PHE83_16755 [Opitutaceae bacterium]|nr:hypothetical protein [Opitutaceae bacterium]
MNAIQHSLASFSFHDGLGQPHVIEVRNATIAQAINLVENGIRAYRRPLKFISFTPQGGDPIDLTDPAWSLPKGDRLRAIRRMEFLDQMRTWQTHCANVPQAMKAITRRADNLRRKSTAPVAMPDEAMFSIADIERQTAEQRALFFEMEARLIHALSKPDPDVRFELRAFDGGAFILLPDDGPVPPGAILPESLQARMRKKNFRGAITKIFRHESRHLRFTWLVGFHPDEIGEVAPELFQGIMIVCGQAGVISTWRQLLEALANGDPVMDLTGKPAGLYQFEYDWLDEAGRCLAVVQNGGVRPPVHGLGHRRPVLLRPVPLPLPQHAQLEEFIGPEERPCDNEPVFPQLVEYANPSSEKARRAQLMAGAIPVQPTLNPLSSFPKHRRRRRRNHTPDGPERLALVERLIANAAAPNLCPS